MVRLEILPLSSLLSLFPSYNFLLLVILSPPSSHSSPSPIPFLPSIPHQLSSHSLSPLLIDIILLFCCCAAFSPAGAQSIRLEPTPFRSTITIFPDDVVCFRRTDYILCLNPNPLTDGMFGPDQPDLNAANDRSSFVVWDDTNPKPFLSIEPRNNVVMVSSVDLYVLNYPMESIGLPNLELFNTANAAVITDPPLDSAVLFDLVGNGQLSQGDSTVRRVTLRFRTPMTVTGLLLRWNFSGLLNVNFFFMSEFVMCTDPLPVYNTGSISFLAPSESMTTVVPTTEFLTTKPLTLTCTVSNEGSFVWRWRRGPVTIVESSKTSLLTADGTRTSILIINQLDFDDAGTYLCEATFSSVLDFYPRLFDVSFPRKSLLGFLFR